MHRFVWFWIAAVLGVLLLALGLLVPIHIRAIDDSVLKAAGRYTETLGARASALLAQQKPGPVQMLLSVIQAEGLPERVSLAKAAGELARRQPRLDVWGSPAPRWAGAELKRPEGGNGSFTEFVVRKEHRAGLIDYLAKSRNRGAIELLQCREMTNTVIFPPSWTSSGQALDAALTVCGLLMIESSLTPAFSNSVFSLAYEANRGANPHPLEQALLDLMSFGQRLNWGQLTTFMRDIEDPETLRNLANLVRRSEGDLPALYAAVILSRNPAGVVRYVMNFGKTGLRDLRSGLHYGSGGLRLLLDRNQRLRHSPFDSLLSDYLPFAYLAVIAWQAPIAALAIKWLLYLASGYFFALAVHVFLRRRARRRFELFAPGIRTAAGDDEDHRPLDLPPVRGFHVARELLFALGFLLVVLLLSEPFLAQDSQKMDFPFRLRLPMVASAAAAGPGIIAKPSSFMNQLSLLTLLLFFVLQSLIYTACMFKLAEIRRQKVGPRMKIKLLDNEDHLFDAGLYLGFVGTIISLILVSLGVIKPSLMAAYSSTSFGIIFVSFFKIFNLRPLKRRLILEAEAVSPRLVSSESARPQPIS